MADRSVPALHLGDPAMLKRIALTGFLLAGCLWCLIQVVQAETG
jgi:hypothetical protein